MARCNIPTELSDIPIEMFYSAEAIMVYREQYHPCAERLNRDLAAVDSQNLSLAERVGNVLRRQGIAPAPKRCQTTTWKEFIRAHMAVLAGVDFFTVEVLTWRGLATYYVLFLHQTGDPAADTGRRDAASHHGLDGADGPQCDRPGGRATVGSICVARS